MPLRIGIIGGDDRFAGSLADVLAADGHSVQVLQPAELRRPVSLPDLLIAEISAEGGDLIEAVTRLHRGKDTRLLPIVVISSSAELEDELPPVLDFIRKPVDMGRLREDIGAVARGAAQRMHHHRAEQLSEAEYRRFSDFLASYSGLRFAPRNIGFLTRGIRSRMQVLHIHSFGDYFEYLARHHESRQEMQKLLQLLTVGETYFFRYRPHFDVLSRLIKKQLGSGDDASLRIWSAGCSTGEEPYSIAMQILDACPEWRTRHIRLLATDINRRSLKKASEGIYRPWAMRAMDQRHIRRYFDKSGESYRIKADVKEMVDFFPLNLKSSPFPLPAKGLADLDAVFCRNVLIYFGIDETRAIIEKIAATLKPGGHLFLGHSETLSFLSTQFERHSFAGGFYYRKRTGAPLPLPLREPKPARGRSKIPGSMLRPEPVVVAAEPERKPDPEALLRQARIAFETEEYETASRILDELLALQPDHVGALVLRSFILGNAGKWDDALALCDRVLSLDDLRPDAYLLRGLILEHAGESAEAAAEYRKAILLDMKFIMPHYYLGRLMLRLGRDKEGNRELRTCLKILERLSPGETIPYGGGITHEGLLRQLRREVGTDGHEVHDSSERMTR